MEAIERDSAPLFRDLEKELLDTIRSAATFGALDNMRLNFSALAPILALAIFNVSLVGRAQVYTTAQSDALAVIRADPSSLSYQGEGQGEVSGRRFAELVLTEDFEPLPFEEAIRFFGDKTSLSPAEFAVLERAAQAKAFTIADGARTVVREQVKGLIERALTEGVTLSEFQREAARVIDSVGLNARTPWYWQTVYRTNLQTSYQVGRWQQMTHPDVVEHRPYLRYVSARLPSTRPSHAEKHGLIYPVDHKFWKVWYPPNGFNCYCTVTSVSEALLSRRNWTVNEQSEFAFPDPDEGFDTNPALSEAA